MITLELSLCGFGLKSYDLTGSYQGKAYYLYMGVAVARYYSPVATSQIIKAVRGIAQDPDWLINTAPTVRRAARLGYAKGKARARADLEAKAELWKNEYTKADAERTTLQLENRDLRTTINTLRSLASDAWD